MRILIAEDDPVSRRLLEATLVKWKYEAVVTVDGNEAWEVLQREGAPELAILDWAMPGLDGVELCQRLRRAYDSQLPYIILLTARGGPENMVEGLGAGADDFVAKPFDTDELHARIQVGERVLGLTDRVSGPSRSTRTRQFKNQDPPGPLTDMRCVQKDQGRQRVLESDRDIHS